MSNHFRALGLLVESEEDYATLIERAANEGEFMPTARGGYVRWTAGAGVEVWAQINADNQLTGGNLHYVGESQVRLGVTGLIETNEADVSLYGWMEPPDDDIEAGAYPLVCDVPAYYLRPTPLELPQVVRAQITAFAHDLTCFPDEDAFNATQDSEPKFAANFFIPTGLFITGSEDDEEDEAADDEVEEDAEGDIESPIGEADDLIADEETETREDGAELVEGEVPQPYAMFAGTVKEARLVRNIETELEFLVLSVETYGATLDVVADPHGMEGRPVIGGIVSGTFYLSAHLLDLTL